MRRVAHLLFGAFLLLAPSLITAQIRNYPFKVGPISIPGLSDVQLEAEIRNGNYCLIKVFPYGNIDEAVSKDVNPFESNEFSAALQAALDALDEAKGFAGSFEKLKDEDVLRLFYYLKGSEYVQPRGSEEPEAGRLCFSKDVMVKRTSTNQYQLIKFEVSRDSFARIQRDIYLKVHPELKSKKKKRALFQASQKNYEEIKFKEKLDEYRDGLERMTGVRDFTRLEKAVDGQQLELMNMDTFIRDLIKCENELKERLIQLPSFAWEQVEDILDGVDNSLKKALPELEELADWHLSYPIDREMEGNDSLMIKYEVSRELFAQAGASMKRLAVVYAKDDRSSSFTTESEQYAGMIGTIGESRTEFYNDQRALFRSLAYVPLDIDFIDIEFNEGFIEHILVSGYLDLYDERDPYLKAAGRTGASRSSLDADNYLSEGRSRQRIKFENNFPFGFSRKRDFSRLRNYNLRGRAYGDGEVYELRLKDVFEVYLQQHAVGRRDFSPRNMLMHYEPGKKESCIPLHKEETFKLFEARLYSDFVGLDDQASNGLLQTEVAKRMNINTSRMDVRAFNMGCLAWVEPSIAISKIEKNNKFLPLQASSDTTSPTPFYAATLDLRRYEAFSVGFNANLGYLDVPSLKSSFMLNFGLRWGRTPVRDFADVERGVNTFDWMPELAVDVKADERWGLSFAWQHHFFSLLDRNTRQIGDPSDPDGQKFGIVKSNRFQTVQTFLFFRPTEDAAGRLFFRYRYNWEVGDIKLGFHQAQLGYSFYLLGRYKPKDYQEKVQSN